VMLVVRRRVGDAGVPRKADVDVRPNPDTIVVGPVGPTKPVGPVLPVGPVGPV
jgi:hypothetical protein